MPDLLSSLDAGVSAALQANRPLDVVNALRRQRVARAVYNRLEPFFLNGVEDFLAALDQARGALTGSWAAELVLAPVSWTPQDLDIVVPGPDDDSKKVFHISSKPSMGLVVDHYHRLSRPFFERPGIAARFHIRSAR